MRIGCETGEWDWRKIGRTLSNEDIADWAAFFRLQQQALDKDRQGADATAARRAAERRLDG